MRACGASGPSHSLRMEVLFMPKVALKSWKDEGNADGGQGFGPGLVVELPGVHQHTVHVPDGCNCQ